MSANDSSQSSTSHQLITTAPIRTGTNIKVTPQQMVRTQCIGHWFSIDEFLRCFFYRLHSKLLIITKVHELYKLPVMQDHTTHIQWRIVRRMYRIIRTELKRKRKLIASSSVHFPSLLILFTFLAPNSQSVQNFMRRRRNADRSGKGLRHFSMKVCKKVEAKSKTTYNEVADELVEEVNVSDLSEN